MAYKKHEHYSLVIRISIKHVPLLQLLQWSYLYWGQVLRHWQRGAAGMAREERLGLSCAGCSSFQLFPKDPLQGTGEPSSQDGVSSGKMYLKKGRRHWREEEEAKVRNIRGNAKIRKGRGGGPPCRRSRYPLQPIGGPHAGAVERCERKGVLTTAHPAAPSFVPLIASLKRLSVTCGDRRSGRRGAGSEGVKTNPGWGEEMCWFSACLFVSCYLNQ